MDHSTRIGQHVATQLVQTTALDATKFLARHTMDQARPAVFAEIAIQVTPAERAAREAVDVRPRLGRQIEVREGGGDAERGAGLVPALGAVAEIDFQRLGKRALETHSVALASCEHLGFGASILCNWVCVEAAAAAAAAAAVAVASMTSENVQAREL